jgi:two-component system, OmpR family, phosphate regulon sensor histidine kinase PhoR
VTQSADSAQPVDALTAHATTAAERLLAQFRAVADIFDAVNIVVYVADLVTHELLFLNSHALKLWGPSAIGRKCYEVLQTGQQGRCGFCTNDRLIEHGHATEALVWEFQNTKTHRWFLCIDKAIPWTDGRLVRMEVAIDISDRKAAEQFHEQYLSLISHDLRNPLSALILRGSALRRQLEKLGLGKERDGVESMLANARRMEEMLDDLLETSRLESGTIELHRERLNLGRLVHATAERVGGDEEPPRILVEAERALFLTADRSRLERVLENLLTNALRHGASGSPVVVRVEADGEQAQVAVRDQGQGMTPAVQGALFQRFFRAKNTGSKGLGLGLYISRLIVERHGGRIWAESEPGAGSTFRFTLPRGEAS